MKLSKPFRSNGFTLIELMITLAVATILLTVALPSYSDLLKNNLLATQSNQLVSAFTLARSEAVKRRESISLCPSSNQATCVSSSTNWATGWIVTESDGTVIRAWQAVDTTTTLTANASSITFVDTGSLFSATITFTMKVSDCTGMQERTISVSRQGNPNVSSVSCS